MSQETARARADLPNPRYFQAATYAVGWPLRAMTKMTSNGTEFVPTTGGASGIANHISPMYDVPIVDMVLRKTRVPYFPAKEELNVPVFGPYMKGGGALFFQRKNEADRRRVYAEMRRHVGLGHFVLTMGQGTSKNPDKEIAAIYAGALNLALSANLGELLLIGIGGTGQKLPPRKAHVEIATLPLNELTGPYKLAGKGVPSPKRREFNNDVVLPSLQKIVDTAHEQAAS